MPTTIQNNTDQRVLLRFNSGRAQYLAPREALEGIEHVEIKANDRIRTLEARHVIALQEAGEKAPLRSHTMTASKAIAHIGRSDLESLRDFISPGEDRTTVLRAIQEKREA